MAHPYDWINGALNTIHQAHWYRSTAAIEESIGTQLRVAGQPLINFAGNDYLSLATDPRLKLAAQQAIDLYGTGSTGSRLVTGQRPLHQELEQAIAQLHQTEAAMVFSSGYLANLGTIAAVVGDRDVIFSDQYNHSSLKNGALLSKAKVLEYQHGNMVDLRAQLQAHRPNFRRCLIVTDSIFSMDGDLCPLPEIVAVAEEFGAMLLVDEAHAVGVLGATGAGGIEQCGLQQRELIHIGTLSKALGSLGGYVAGTAALIDFLRNRCPSWIYTTALSPADTAAALAALQVMKAEPERRDRLGQNIDYLRASLVDLPLGRILPSQSAVICWELPSATVALQVAAALRSHGIFAPAIRPPTVPTSRIRLTVMADHRQPDLDYLVSCVRSMIDPKSFPDEFTMI
jgi:8-amino-7-oxononanoate synthase